MNALERVAETRRTRARRYGEMTDEDPRHGTNTGYAAGCRCPGCQSGHRRRKKELRNYPRPLVTAVGVRRRVEALQCMGHSAAAVSRELGRERTWLNKVLRNDRVQVETLALVVTVYDRLSMVHATGEQADRTRARAARSGYAPPLAWDPDTIDNPAAVPDGVIDPNARTTAAQERAALLDELVDEGADLWQVLDRLDVTRHGFHTWCSRYGYADTYRALVAREYERSGSRGNQHTREDTAA